MKSKKWLSNHASMYARNFFYSPRVNGSKLGLCLLDPIFTGVNHVYYFFVISANFHLQRFPFFIVKYACFYLNTWSNNSWKRHTLNDRVNTNFQIFLRLLLVMLIINHWMYLTCFRLGMQRIKNGMAFVGNAVFREYFLSTRAIFSQNMNIQPY